MNLSLTNVMLAALIMLSGMNNMILLSQLIGDNISDNIPTLLTLLLLLNASKRDLSDFCGQGM